MDDECASFVYEVRRNLDYSVNLLAHQSTFVPRRVVVGHRIGEDGKSRTYRVEFLLCNVFVRRYDGDGSVSGYYVVESERSTREDGGDENEKNEQSR